MISSIRKVIETLSFHTAVWNWLQPAPRRREGSLNALLYSKQCIQNSLQERPFPPAQSCRHLVLGHFKMVADYAFWPHIYVSSASPSWFYAGPANRIAYIPIQGIFTVLAMKEVVSVTRNFVKGSSSSLKPNSAILWHMVRNWEDLFKIVRQLLFPRRMHDFVSNFHRTRAPLSRFGWKRFAVSGFVALWLFGVDVGLIFGSIPASTRLENSGISKLKWTNDWPVAANMYFGDIVCQSSSQEIKLYTEIEEVRFVAKPFRTVNRTEISNTSSSFPSMMRYLLNCDNSDRRRVTCHVYSHKRLFRYDLALHLDIPSQ